MSNLQNSLGLSLASKQASSMASNNTSSSSSSFSSGGSSSSSSPSSSSSSNGSNEWQKSVEEAKAYNAQRAQNTAGVVQFNQGQNINSATVSTSSGESQNYGQFLQSNTPSASQAIPAMQNMQPQAQETKDWNVSKFEQTQKDWQERQNILWEQRQQEMQKNMQKMQSETSDFLTNRNKFNLMTGYENKNEQERKVVDDYWKNNQHEKPKSANDYYNQIKSGVAPSDAQRNHPAYSEAEKTVARINGYRNMTSGQLARMFSSGEMSSSDLALLAKEDQSFAHQVAFTNSLNNKGQVDFEKDQQKISDEILKNWYTDMNNDERTNLLVSALSNDTNIANAMETSKQKANALAELQKSLLVVGENLEDELKGKNVSKSYIQALKAKRSSRIHTAIASAQIDYSNAINYQKDLIENKKYDIDYQRQLEQREYEIGAYTYKTRLGQQVTQENAQFNTNLALQKAQAEFEQKIAQDEQIRENPTLATQSLIDSYREQGVTAMRSDQEIIASVQSEIASGKSLGEVLTDLNQAFQGKDEYKTLQRLHNGQMSDAQKLQAQQQFALQQGAINQQYSLQTLAQQNKYNIENGWGYDENIGAYVNVNTGEVRNIAQNYTKAQEAEYIANFIQGSEGFRDTAYLDSAGVWTIGYGTISINGVPVKQGDTITKEKATQIFTEQMEGYQNWKNYIDESTLSTEQKTALTSFEYNLGSGIWKKDAMPIINALKNGDIASAQSHMKKYVNAGGKYVQGLANRREREANLLAVSRTESAEGQSSGGYDDADINFYNSLTSTQKEEYRNTAEYQKFVQDKKKIMSDTDSTLTEILQYSNGGKQLGTTQEQSLSKFQQAMSQIANIQEEIQKTNTGPVIGRLKSLNPWDTDARVLKSSLNALIPNLARGVYGEVGVLTDADVKLYSQTIPNLNDTEATNKAIMAMTLQTMAEGFKSQMKTKAAAGFDVSGFSGVYENYINQVNSLRESVGMPRIATDSEILEQRQYIQQTAETGKQKIQGFIGNIDEMYEMIKNKPQGKGFFNLF